MPLTTVQSGMMDSTAQYYSFKNRIINGAMVIDQRNAGASVTAAGSVGYTLDRWVVFYSQNSKFSVQQNAGAVTPPAGFSNYLGVTSLSAYSVTSTDYNFVNQRVEGFNAADLAWGTANAATVTLSFWVRSSLTGTFSGSLRSGSGAIRSYVFTYTISAANTWEQKTITISGDTSGTWPTNNNTWGSLTFCIGSGSTRLGTAGSWQTADLDGATGTTSVVGTNGATFYITGVQLEKGSTATSFDYRPYGTELVLCQRYCQIVKNGVGCWVSSTQCQINLAQNTEMRAAPTLSQTGVLTVTDYVALDATQSSTSIAVLNTNTAYGTVATISNFSGATTGRVAGIRPYSSYSGYILMTAEL